MNLIDFCTYQGGTGAPSCPVLRRMAARNGVAIRTLYMIARGHKLPGARLCSRLEAYTNGTVKREELRPDIFRNAEVAFPTPSEGYVAAPEGPSLAMTAAGQLFGLTASQACAVYQSMLSARPEVKP